MNTDLNKNDFSGRGRKDDPSSLTESRVRAIIKEEIEKNYKAGSPQVPPHTHDRNNNLPIPFSSISGNVGNKIIYTPDSKNVNNIANYTDPNLLAITGSVILNNYYTADGKTITDPSVPTLTYTFPIPVFGGDGFEGGAAPIGTMVLASDGSGSFNLYIAVTPNGQWMFATLSI